MISLSPVSKSKITIDVRSGGIKATVNDYSGWLDIATRSGSLRLAGSDLKIEKGKRVSGSFGSGSGIFNAHPSSGDIKVSLRFVIHILSSIFGSR